MPNITKGCVGFVKRSDHFCEEFIRLEKIRKIEYDRGVSRELRILRRINSEAKMKNDNSKAISFIRLVGDILLIAAAYIIAYVLRFRVLDDVGVFALTQKEKYYTLGEYARYLVFIIPGYIFIYSKCKLYDLRRRKQVEVWALTKANIGGILFFTFILYYLKELDFSRYFFTFFFILNIVFGLSFRYVLNYLLRALRSRGLNLKHVVIIGYSAAARGYIDRVKANPQWGYYIHGIIDDEKGTDFTYNGIPVIGNMDDVDAILEQHNFDEIIIALSINDYYKLRRVVGKCEKSGSHTKFIPDYNHIIPTIPVMEDFFGLPVINIRNVPLASFVNALVKRLFDIVVGLMALLIAAIPMLFIGILIKITTRGKVFYSQERVGLHNKPFRMYKFCSMVEARDGEDQNEWSNANNQRVTRIGHFLRKTSLDELPQLFNVLKGDMSLVGPRPERLYFVEKFKEEIPRYMIKHQVRPGITGWAQVNGLRGDTSIEKRIEYDLYYIENWTLRLDIKIMLMTVFTGAMGKNAY